MREEGIGRLRQVADAASAEVGRAKAAFERVQAQAAELGQHVRLAQALATSDPAAWHAVEPESCAAFLTHLLRWADARGHHGGRAARAGVGPAGGASRYPHSKGPIWLTLSQLPQRRAPGGAAAGPRRPGGAVDRQRRAPTRVTAVRGVLELRQEGPPRDGKRGDQWREARSKSGVRPGAGPAV